MKIVKRGILPEKRIYIGVCPYCQTVMEAEQGELNPSSHCRSAYVDDCWGQKCLLCNNATIFRLKPPGKTND